MIGDEGLLANTEPGPSGAPYNAFYTCARDSRQACVLEPYFDEASGSRKLVTGVAFPLLENGKVIAVVGLDINLAALQKNSETSALQLFDGHGQISIVSPRGVISASSQDVSRLGQPMDNAQVMEALRQGQPKVFDDPQQINVLEPLPPIAGAAPWGVLVGVAPRRIAGTGRHPCKSNSTPKPCKALRWNCCSVAARPCWACC